MLLFFVLNNFFNFPFIQWNHKKNTFIKFPNKKKIFLPQIINNLDVEKNPLLIN